MTAPFPLGTDNGAGFGWHDIDVVKLGAGMAGQRHADFARRLFYNTRPIASHDAQSSIIAPAVVQHHNTGGLEHRLRAGTSIERSGAYVPDGSISGGEAIGNPTHDVEIFMHQ
ncbi:MAG: hypothetical protein IPL91_11290 [Hyphomicrobium sp.]|nr:hypothetical protein [Hyphomicrobium sp.]